MEKTKSCSQQISDFLNELETIRTSDAKALHALLQVPYSHNEVSYELCKKAIDEYGSFSILADYGLTAFANEANLNPMQKNIIKFMREAMKHPHGDVDLDDKRVTLKTFKATAKYVHRLFYGKTHECVYLLYVDTSYKLLHRVMITSSNFSSVNLETGAILMHKPCKGICGLILAHNHPAGSIMPSDDDVATLGKILEQIENSNIIFIDSLIATDDVVYSMTHDVVHIID